MTTAPSIDRHAAASAPADEHPLDAYATGTLTTSVGAAYPGYRAVFRGRDIHQEVMWDTGWVQLTAQAAGVELTAAQARLMETFWVNSSYPDARIWNNRVAALVGSMRGTPVMALAAANAVSEALIYGRRNEYRAVAFFRRTREALDAGGTLDDALAAHQREHGNLPGYGRPLHNGDERIAPMMRAAEAAGLHDGPHVRLAFAIEEHLLADGRPLRMNAGALVSAFGADFGFTPRQWALMMFPTFTAGMTPCYLEALERPIGAVFAARVNQVDYEGPAPRRWD